MLAEPRRRQKYSLNPRGLDWSKDDNKFGQKLLEKMGWKKGGALGLMEDGNTEPIKVTTKSDRRGVGCTVKNADNWIAHQDEFSSILAGLSEAGGTTKSNEDTATAFSLEQTSKNSRSRVHYQKFAKGKDLSRYETADLQSIFGRRKKQSTSISLDVTSEPLKSKESETEQSFGVITVTSSTSIGSYFAQKMAEMKERLARSGNSSSTMARVDSGSTPISSISATSDDTVNCATERVKKRHREVEVECEDVMEEYVATKESKKKRRCCNDVQEIAQTTEETEEQQKKKRKKDKKHRKKADETLSASNVDEVSSCNAESHANQVCWEESNATEESTSSGKKSKKSKKRSKSVNEPAVEQPSMEDVDLQTKKKKKNLDRS